ncbi:hypothetical protein OHA88_07200 [Streptomyces sp. NBC_00353]
MSSSAATVVPVHHERLAHAAEPHYRRATRSVDLAYESAVD